MFTLLEKLADWLVSPGFAVNYASFICLNLEGSHSLFSFWLVLIEICTIYLDHSHHSPTTPRSTPLSITTQLCVLKKQNKTRPNKQTKPSSATIHILWIFGLPLEPGRPNRDHTLKGYYSSSQNLPTAKSWVVAGILFSLSLDRFGTYCLNCYEFMYAPELLCPEKSFLIVIYHLCPWEFFCYNAAMIPDPWKGEVWYECPI